MLIIHDFLGYFTNPYITNNRQGVIGNKELLK